MKATILIAALSSVLLRAQPVSSTASNEKHLAFEVVSIRRHTADSGPVETGPVGICVFGVGAKKTQTVTRTVYVDRWGGRGTVNAG